ncbi:hypothetical protein J5N97_017515 [Dioscorea zingiberensis]|uniref:DUF7876 domain-containing protein n=1 Tax=Dioscorea zingiberensis TaxID=325984 RepID=A0A9D5CP81_9LILI|nr:hypothetical protein J5N97_017515 [Dioscorea zingiberensis]
MYSSGGCPRWEMVPSPKKEFISAGVNAYALGCTDEGLRKELISVKDSNTEIEGLQSYGGGTSIRFKILSEEIF